MENSEKSTLPMSDAEYIRRLRVAEVAPFLRLADLLGNDARALRAMREESKFIRAHPGTPVGKEFADKVRGWLISNKLEWNQENLEKAVAAAKKQTYENHA